MKRLKRAFSWNRRRRSAGRGRSVARPGLKRFSPRFEQLEERTLLSINPLGTEFGAIGAPGDSNDLTLTIDPGSGTHSLSILMQAAEGSTLDPGPITIFDSDDNPVAPLSSDPDHTATGSLAIAHLSPGEYTLSVGGERGTTGDYRVDICMTGDSNGDGRVSEKEQMQACAAFLQHKGGLNYVTELLFRQQGIDFSGKLYQKQFDADLDGDVDKFDFAQIERNQGQPGISFELIGDNDPPVIDAALSNDTGRDPDDGITSDATISGTIADANQVAALRGGFDDTPEADYVPLDFVAGNGAAFTLSADVLQGIPGGDSLENTGWHTLYLLAEDEFGNVTPQPFGVEFTLITDNHAPTAANPFGNQYMSEDADTLSLTLVGPGGNLFADEDLTIGDNLKLSIVNSNGQLVDATFRTQSSTELDEVIVTADTQAVWLDLDVLHHQHGTAEITIRAEDASGVAAAAVNTFELTVTAVNDAPTFDVGPDQTVDEDSGSHAVDQFIGNISPGADNEAGQVLTFEVTTDNDELFADAPEIDAAGKLTYALAADAFGEAVVTVVLSDNGGTADGGQDTSVSQTFEIEVAPVNDTPSFEVGPDQQVDEDSGEQTVSAFVKNISKGPDNESGQTLEFLVTTDNDELFSAGPQIDPATGNLAYTPADDAHGTTTVSMRLKDSGGGEDTSVAQTFEIEIGSMNDLPTFDLVDGGAIAREDAPPQVYEGFATNISPGPENESDETLDFLVTTDNDALFSALPQIDPATGNLTYTPAPDATGQATVTVRLKDNGGPPQDTSPAKTFHIEVYSVNDPPEFTLGSAPSVLEDAGAQTVTGLAQGISPGGGADETGQTLEFLVTTDNDELFDVLPQIDPATGDLTYTPAGNANGTATVFVELRDDGGGDNTSQAQTFDIVVEAVNDPPTANDDPGLLVTIGMENVLHVLGNDSIFPDAGETLTITWVSQAANGQVSISPDGKTLLYTTTPGLGEGTTDQFTYTIRDDGSPPLAAPAAATVNVTFIINNVNAVDDSFGADDGYLEDNGPYGLDVRANDSDDQGHTYKVVSVTQGDRNGFVEVGQDGLFVWYTPAPDFFGEERFTYTLEDSQGAQATAEVVVDVAPLNDPPSFSLGPDPTVEEDSGQETIANFGRNMSMGPDETGQSLQFLVETDNDGLFFALPQIAPDGTLTFTPADNANGSATVTVRLKDDAGGDDTSAPQTFTINVTPVNDRPSFSLPTGGAEDQSVPEDSGQQTVAGFATDISPGPTADETAQQLEFIINVSNPDLFAVGPQIDPISGNLTYTSAPDANGSATVIVRLKDDAGGTDTSTQQTFDITVTPVNDPPSFSLSPDPTVLEDAGPQTLDNFAWNISMEPDDSGQPLAFILATDNDALFSALPQIDRDTGTLTFTAADDANGSATVTVRLRDDGGENDLSDPQTFTINVTPVDDVPVFTYISDVNVKAGSPLWIPLDGLKSDGEELTFTVETSNDSLLETEIPQGNRSMRISVFDYGDMVFELYEHLVPGATQPIIDVAKTGVYDGELFYRVVNGFVIQGGTQGTANVSQFDDQYHVDLQHNQSGVLSLAKSNDDTNTTEFFVCELNEDSVTYGYDVRTLDFNHSIIGQLIEGEDVREAISDTEFPQGSQEPANDVVMESVVIFDDTENGVLMLKALGDPGDEIDVTVTVEDENGNQYPQTFRVTIQEDTHNGAPFLAPIPDVETAVNTPVDIQLTAIDVEGDEVVFSTDYVDNVEIDNATGVATITPPDGFTGEGYINIKVTQVAPFDGVDQYDEQWVKITVV